MNSLLPQHVGIIIDGNRRWAIEQKLPNLEGHRRGMLNVEKLLNWAKSKKIKVLTLFVFSTENWRRSKFEVRSLMRLLDMALNKKNIKNACQNGIRLKVIGQRDKLDKSLQQTIRNAEDATKNNADMVVNLALSYGGRAEITEAIKKIIKKNVPADEITEELVSESLWTSDLDLLIRTGKEQRISNFLIWQAAYSEIYFCKKYWPDFTENDLDEAISDYTRRQRRFGS